MVDLEKLKVEVEFDGKDLDRGKSKFDRFADTVKGKGKEMGNVLDIVGGSVKKLTKFGLALGAGLVGALTGILATSPQFKEFMAKLKPTFLELSLHVGKKLKPLLDDISVGVGKAVKKFIEWDDETGFLENISKNILEAKDRFVEWNKETGFIDDMAKTLSDIAGSILKIGGKILKISFEAIGVDTTLVIGLAAILAASGHPHIAAGLLLLYGIQKLESQGEEYFAESGVQTGLASEKMVLAWNEMIKSDKFTDRVVAIVGALPVLFGATGLHIAEKVTGMGGDAGTVYTGPGSAGGLGEEGWASTTMTSPGQTINVNQLVINARTVTSTGDAYSG